MTALLEILSTSECFIKLSMLFSRKKLVRGSTVQAKSQKMHECSVVNMQMYVCYVRVIIHK